MRGCNSAVTKASAKSVSVLPADTSYRASRKGRAASLVANGAPPEKAAEFQCVLTSVHLVKGPELTVDRIMQKPGAGGSLCPIKNF